MSKTVRQDKKYDRSVKISRNILGEYRKNDEKAFRKFPRIKSGCNECIAAFLNGGRKTVLSRQFRILKNLQWLQYHNYRSCRSGKVGF